MTLRMRSNREFWIEKKGGRVMSEKGKQVIENLERLIPKMSESEVDRLISFGEGMAFMKEQQETKQNCTADRLAKG